MPPHPGLPALLLQLQRSQFLLPAFLPVPELLAVLVHAQTVGMQLLVALQRTQEPPADWDAARLVGAEVLLEVGCCLQEEVENKYFVTVLKDLLSCYL